MRREAKEFQYTIRGVPRSVDRALRRLAERKKMSLNALLVEAVTNAVGVANASTEHRDLDSFIGSWVPDPETEQALLAQRRILPGDWE